MTSHDTPAPGSPEDAVAWRPLTIAMVGQKGLPATIGGVERHVEEIGQRLAARGHEVVVYCRTSYGDVPEDGTYLGMRLVAAPTIGTKHLDAIVHSGTSTLKAIAGGADVVHYHALGPGLAAPLPRYVSRAKVVLTVHGLDNERNKWGRVARAVLGTAHWMSGHVPDATVVVSRELREHYARTFGRAAVYVTNGVTLPPRVHRPDVLERFGLSGGGYDMFVGRLVPEKRPDLLIRAFRQTDVDRRLAIVGSSSFTDGYTAELRELAGDDPRIVFTGFVGGAELAALFQGARLLVQPSDLEGLPFTLLEAVANGCHVLASDISPHREVLGSGSEVYRIFPQGDLDALRAGLLREVGGDPLDNPDRERILEHHSWDRVVDELEELYLTLAAGRRVPSDAVTAGPRQGEPVHPHRAGRDLAGGLPMTVSTVAPSLVAGRLVLADLELVLDGVLPSGRLLGGPVSLDDGAGPTSVAVGRAVAASALDAGSLVLVDEEQTPLGRLVDLTDSPDGVSGRLERERRRESGSGRAASIDLATKLGSGTAVVVLARPPLLADTARVVAALPADTSSLVVVVADDARDTAGVPTHLVLAVAASLGRRVADRVDGLGVTVATAPLAWRDAASDTALLRWVADRLGVPAPLVLSSDPALDPSADRWAAAVAGLVAGADAASSGLAPQDLPVLTRWKRPRSQSGLVVFFTGLSGSGKSTLARDLRERLLAERASARSACWTATTCAGCSRPASASTGPAATSTSAGSATWQRRSPGTAASPSARPIAPYAESRAAVRAMVDAGRRLRPGARLAPPWRSASAATSRASTPRPGPA